MQLTQAEAFCAFDDHDGGVWHIHPYLDDRRGHQDVGLAGNEAPHLEFLVFWPLAPVDDAHSVVGQRETPDDALVAIHQVLEFQRFTLLNERIDDVDLAAEREFVLEEAEHRIPRGVGAVDGSDRLAARGEFIEQADVEVAVGRHGQGARNGGSGHDEHVGRRGGFGPQLRPLLDSEPVLLVDDGQAELAENHARLDQRMGPDRDADLPGRDALEGLPTGRALDVAGEQRRADGQVAEQLRERRKVLLCKDFCRRHDAGLVAVVQRKQRGQQRDDGFAAAHIALQEPVHVPTGVHIRPNLAQDPFLGLGQVERQALGIEPVEQVSYDRKTHTGLVACEFLFPSNEHELQKQQLVEGQTPTRVGRFLRMRWAMHGPDRCLPLHQPRLLTQHLRQRIGNVKSGQFEQIRYQPRDSSRSHSALAEQHGRRIHRLQALAPAGCKGRRRLYLRMWDVPAIPVALWLAVDDHRHADGQMSRHPRSAFEPNEVTFPRGILEFGDRPARLCGSGLFHARDDAAQLHSHRVGRNVTHAAEPRPVFVPKRCMQQQITERLHPQFRRKQFRALRPHPFQEGQRRFDEGVAHPRPFRPTSAQAPRGTL